MELVESSKAGINAKRVLAAFRDLGSDVIHIQHISTRPTATFLLPNSIGAEIHSDVAPSQGELILVKNYPNSFRGTGLHDIMAERKIERLVFAGMMTHMCIDTTVRAAFDYGYKCILLSDCCATKNLAHENKTISAEDVNTAYFSGLNGMFAEVMTSQSFLSECSIEGC